MKKKHSVIWRNTFCVLEKYISIPQTCDTLTHTDVAFLAPNFDLVFIAETWINISEFVLSLILIFGISSPTDNWIIFCFEWVSSHVPQPLLLVLISHLGNLTSECVIIFQIQYTYYFFKPPPPPPFGLNQNTLHVMTCKCWTFLESKYEKNWSG